MDLNEIRDSKKLSKDLEKLSQINSISIEHHNWMFRALLKNFNMPSPKSVSLESNKTLNETIIDYNSKLKKNIKLALEAYTGQFASELHERMQLAIKEAVGLKRFVYNPPKTKDTHRFSTTRIWQMFHVKGKFIKDHRGIIKEVDNLESIFKLVNDYMESVNEILVDLKDRNGDFNAIKSILERKAIKRQTFHLMFNRTLDISFDGGVLNEVKVKAPEISLNWRDLKALPILLVALLVTVPFMIETKSPFLKALKNVIPRMAAMFIGAKTFFRSENEVSRESEMVLRAISELDVLGDSMIDLHKNIELFAREIDKLDNPIMKSLIKSEAAHAMEITTVTVKHFQDLCKGFKAMIKEMTKK